MILAGWPEAAASFMWALGSNLVSRPEAVRKQRALRRQYLRRSHSSARIWRVRSGKLRPGTDVTSSWTGHTGGQKGDPRLRPIDGITRSDEKGQENAGSSADMGGCWIGFRQTGARAHRSFGRSREYCQTRSRNAGASSAW